MASSSSGPRAQRGRGRPPKGEPDDALVDRLLSMIDDKGEKPDAGQAGASKEDKKAAKGDPKGAAKKEKRADAKSEKDVKKEKKKDEAKAKGDKDAQKEAAKAKGPYEWPADPNEERLTAAGAVCDAQSRLQLSAYTDLRKWFQGEPSERKHPDPSNPGLRQEELPGGSAAVSLDGLHNWTDDKGAGWKTMRKAVPGKNKSESRWFGANSWGSWRMAFLLARLQHQVWKAASEGQAPPAQAAQAQAAQAAQEGRSLQAKPAEQAAQVGVEDWRNFSPKTVDSTKCLARTWNDGMGGQCQEERPAGEVLCYKHQRMAVSKQGLLNGLVDGPIPERRLQQFQEAAVRGLGLGRKRGPVPDKEEKEEPPRKRVKLRQRKKSRDPESKDPQKSKESKEAQEAKEAKEARKKDSEAEGRSKPSAKSKRSRRSNRNRTSHVLKEESKEGTLPPQKPTKETDLFGRRPGPGPGRPKKSEAPKPSPKDAEPAQVQGEVRSRRLMAKMSNLEQQRRNQNKWTSVDDAMDQALNQIDVETQKGPLKSLVNAQGCIPASSMGKAVEAMKATPLDHRLPFTMVLRKTMLHTPSSTTEFMMQGGVAALRQWLKDALPAPGQATTRQHEEVVLECLGLLHEVPVTLQILQQTGIGSTLMAIRNYVAPAMADAGELVAKWMKQFSKELKRSKAVPSAPAASTAGASSSSKGPPPAPVPVQPVVQNTAPQKRPNFATRMLWRKRERQRNAQNEMEATLRELFRLHQVLEEDPPEQNLDLRHLDLD